ncbi:MAG TPA: DctP family TRAP transporter solute-binding subunit [Clostridia bacterium]|nr:DctP family TRAP transporter solute-binding subunit [Clostridia bacterium]
MKKKVALFLVVVFMASLLAGCGGGGSSPSQEPAEQKEATAQPIVLRLGHNVTEATALHRGALEFAKLVEQKSNGTIKVDVFPNATLGDNRQMLEGMQLGSVDMCLPNLSNIAGFTDKTAVFELPYLFKNEAAAEAVFDGPIGDELFADLEKSGLVGLAYWTQGWRHITTSNREVRKPEDMKGLKFRTMENERHMQHFNALGASAIPMAFSELYSSLQQGIIDGQENPYVNIYLNGLYECQKYITETGHIYDAIPLLISKITWDKLTPEQQQILREAAKEVTSLEREMSREDDRKYKQAIIDSGKCQIIELTPEERQAFRDAAQVVYDMNRDKIGADYIQRILDAQEGF